MERTKAVILLIFSVTTIVVFLTHHFVVIEEIDRFAYAPPIILKIAIIIFISGSISSLYYVSSQGK